MSKLNKFSMAFGFLALAAVAAANWTFYWPTTFGKISRDEVQEVLGVDDAEFKDMVERRDFKFYFYDHRTATRVCSKVTNGTTLTRRIDVERLESGDLLWEPVVRYNKDGTIRYPQITFTGVENPVVITPKQCPAGWTEVSVTPIARNRYLRVNDVRVDSVLAYDYSF